MFGSGWNIVGILSFFNLVVNTTIGKILKKGAADIRTTRDLKKFIISTSFIQKSSLRRRDFHLIMATVCGWWKHVGNDFKIRSLVCIGNFATR